MWLTKNKKLLLLITVAALIGLFAFTLFNHKPGPNIEPNRLPAPTSVSLLPLNSRSLPDAELRSKESIVRFNNEGQKQKFLVVNNLSADELKPVEILPSTYTISRPIYNLDSAGALVAENQKYTTLLTPNDPIYPQWYTDKISAPAAWDTFTGSSGITVAVIDSGFALNHEDLVGKWASGSRDFVNNDYDPVAGTTNPNGVGVSHGTQTAGLVGASSNNAKGVAAVNWASRILPIQALDDDGEGTTANVASAVRYAVSLGAKVINLSLGTPWQDPILKAELDYAQSRDVLVVAAAGNCGSPATFSYYGCDFAGQMVYPANYSQVLAVGASDSNDARASFSSYGENLDVLAPGSGSIRTTTWLSGNQTSSYTSDIYGTSFSSPIVAGLAALYRGYNPAATATETANAIVNNADKLASMSGQNFASEFGFGRINAARTLQSSLPSPAATQPVPASPETNATPLPSPSIATAHPDGTLIYNSNGTGIEIIQDGMRAPIISGAIITSHGFSWGTVKTPTAGDKALPLTSAYPYREGTLLASRGFIFVVDISGSGVQQKRWISSWDVFVGLGYKESDLLHVPWEVLPSADGPDFSSSNQHPDGTLIYTADNSGVVLIQNGQRRNIIYGEIFTSYSYQWSQIKIPIAADNNLTSGSDLSSFREGTLISSLGRVYVADTAGGSAQKRWVNSWDAFIALGYKSHEITDVPAYKLPAADGQPLSL